MAIGDTYRPNIQLVERAHEPEDASMEGLVELVAADLPGEPVMFVGSQEALDAQFDLVEPDSGA